MPTKQPRTLRAAKPASPSALSLTATATLDLRANEDGTPKRPTFSIKGYTGATMTVAGFYSPVVVDLAGLKAGRDRLPILLDHDPSKIIGQADEIAIDASGVTLVGTITGDDAHAASVVTHAKNGFQWQASIGASIVRQEFLKSGEKGVVNGREVAGPLLIAREARLSETSFVAVGADSQTTAAVAATSAPPGPSKGAHSMFEQWLQAKGIDPTAIDDNTRAVLRAAFDAEQKAPEDRPTLRLDDLFAGQRKEQGRIDRITELVAEAIRENPSRIDEYEQLSKSAIEAKSSPAEFELSLLRLARRYPGASARPGPRTGPRIVEAAICRYGRLDNLERTYDPQTLEAADRAFPSGLGLKDLILLAARENGYSGHSSNDIRGMMEAAFRPSVDVRAFGFSTLSLPGMMANVANKFLAQGFNAVEAGWREISTIRSVSDFKAITSYALTGSMKYEKVGPAGEIKHGTLGELPYTNRAETYGKMFAITRQDIINDDLGALTQIPTKLGRGAALALNDVFWTAFMATITAFWSSGNGNVSSGAGSALSSAGLSAAQVKFRKQTDPDGYPLGILPKILLVPPELEITADELMSSTLMNTGGSSTTDKVASQNVWASKFRPVVSSYLSNPNFVGNSPAHWFLLADPQELSTIEVAFLNGREAPIVEQADADFSTLGVQMRGIHDFGVGRQEYRASVRSIGS